MINLPDHQTIREAYEPAMRIRSKKKAREYFDALVARRQRLLSGQESMEESIRIEKINIGYYAGYYDHETRARVEGLFECAHPIFGSIAENGVPSVEQALEAGRAIAGSHDQ